MHEHQRSVQLSSTFKSKIWKERIICYHEETFFFLPRKGGGRGVTDKL